MKPFLFVIVPAILDQPLDLNLAGISMWPAQSLVPAIDYMMLIGAMGILVAIVGYKLSDKCMPGERHRKIV